MQVIISLAFNIIQIIKKKLRTFALTKLYQILFNHSYLAWNFWLFLDFFQITGSHLGPFSYSYKIMILKFEEHVHVNSLAHLTRYSWTCFPEIWAISPCHYCPNLQNMNIQLWEKWNNTQGYHYDVLIQ